MGFLCLVVYNSAYAQLALSPELGIWQSATSKATRKATAENKFYVKLYGYYGLLSPGGFSGQGVKPTSTYTYSSGDYSTTKSQGYKVENSFGIGFRAGGGIGVVINDFINLGIDGEYIFGSEVKEKYIVINQYVFSNNTVSSTQEYRFEKKYNYQIVNIIPNITFKAVSKPEYYIYNRLGVVVAIPMNLSFQTTNLEINPGGSDYTYQTTHEMDKGIGIGYQAALGIQFRISDQLRGFTELVLSNLQLKSNGATLTKSTFSYTDEENQPITNPEPITDDNRRIENLNLKIPVSSIGIGVGLAFRF